jgi:hypothetical protein
VRPDLKHALSILAVLRHKTVNPQNQATSVKGGIKARVCSQSGTKIIIFKVLCDAKHTIT